VRFAKAHALGNDFVLVEQSEAGLVSVAWARRLCDRHVGIGADGVIAFALESDGGVAMRLRNADGAEAEISGNGLRCLAAHLVAKGQLPPHHVVYTAAGPRPVEVTPRSATRFQVSIDLGSPVLASDRVPVMLQPPRETVVDWPLQAAGQLVRVTATSLGNPHCAVFLEKPADDALVASLGPALETHPAFPRRTNVEFVTVTSRAELRVRFWERGVGYTKASGTGAASAAVAAILRACADRRLRVVCDGGVLDVSWPEGGTVRQDGEAEVLFEGNWLG
jgi:diaminopimelate epimerase